MKNGKYLVVLDDELFVDYHKFKKSEPLNKSEQERIKKLFHYFKGELITNIAQFNRTGIEIKQSLKKKLAASRLISQSIEELAQSRTQYKVVLSCGRKEFPYVDVTSSDEKIENNFSAFFDIAESRDKAIAHLKALCSDAKIIAIYDKYIDSSQKEERNVELLKRVFPRKNLTIIINNLSDNAKQMLERECANWDVKIDNRMGSSKRHDRYIITDNNLEIILSSGFDHISDTSSDFMYVVRSTDKTRFRELIDDEIKR